MIVPKRAECLCCYFSEVFTWGLVTAILSSSLPLRTQSSHPLQMEVRCLELAATCPLPSYLSLCFAVVIFKVVREGRVGCQSPLGTLAENGK